MERRLYRSRSDRVIWGVCGGLAKYLNVDPVVIRLVMVLLVFANGIGILAYIIMAVIVPLEGSKTAQPRETIRENSPSPTFGEKEVEAEDRDEMLKRHRNFAGIVLILVGLFSWQRTSISSGGSTGIASGHYSSSLLAWCSS